MKNLTRLLGILALIAVCVCAFASDTTKILVTYDPSTRTTFFPAATVATPEGKYTLYVAPSQPHQPQVFKMLAPADPSTPQTFGYSVIVDISGKPYQVIPVITYSLGVQHQLFGFKWLNPTFNLLGGINASEANAGTLGGSLDQGFMISKEATLRLGFFGRGQTGTDSKIRFGPTVSIAGHFGS